MFNRVFGYAEENTTIPKSHVQYFNPTDPEFRVARDYKNTWAIDTLAESFEAEEFEEDDDDDETVAAFDVEAKKLHPLLATATEHK